MKKTSNEWSLSDKYKDIMILDPDGWDRTNYNFSFYEELVTEEEFNNRLLRSTISIAFTQEYTNESN